jgi:hypothetical protein
MLGSRRQTVARKLEAPIPRVALTPPEAAAAIGCGEDFFSEHVRPEVRVIRRGRKVFIAVAELERWVEENAESPVAQKLEAIAPRPNPRTSPFRQGGESK